MMNTDEYASYTSDRQHIESQDDDLIGIPIFLWENSGRLLSTIYQYFKYTYHLIQHV